MDSDADIEIVRHHLGQRRGDALRISVWDTGVGIDEVRADGVRLSDGGEITAATVVWAAGVRAHPLAEQLGVDVAEPFSQGMAKDTEGGAFRVALSTRGEDLGAGDNDLVFTNFVDFDMLYGHRRDIDGYAEALEYFDGRLPEILELMQDDDVLVLCADHGCDPTWEGSDHTREHIPVLVYGKSVEPGSLGRRDTFADIGQSLATHFGLEPMDYGTSFLG